MQEHMHWRRWIDRQPAEPVNMGLGLPWTMLDREVVLLQCCRPAVEQCRPGAHCLQPLQGIVIRIYLEWHGHEVGTELGHSPYNGEAFQFSGGIGFLSLVEGSRGATDDVFLALADLSQDRAEACGRGVGV